MELLIWFAASADFWCCNGRLSPVPLLSGTRSFCFGFQKHHNQCDSLKNLLSIAIFI